MPENLKVSYCFGCMRPLPAGQVTCPYCGWDHSYRHNEGVFLPEGTILYGKYMIGKVLGKGGFGITYLALEITLRVRVAIKEFFPNSISTRQPDSQKIIIQAGNDGWEWYRKGLDAFQNEARTLALFTSPSIVHVREFFLANNTAYIVMDYVDGVSFSNALNLCADSRMPWRRVVTLMMPLMAELQKLHEKNLIHRDIKPENIRIVLDPETGQERLVLLDFGAVRGFSQGTLTYSQVLTPGYAPYEQYLERTHQGPYTDVYALCGTMYRAITGQKPTSAPDRILSGNENLAPFKSFGLNVPKKVEKAIMHGLEWEAKNRPQSMAALYREFERIPALKRDKNLQPLPQAIPDAQPQESDEQVNETRLFSVGAGSVRVKDKGFLSYFLIFLCVAAAAVLLIHVLREWFEPTDSVTKVIEYGDNEKTPEYLETKAASGNTESMIRLGMMYHEGKGVVRSVEKARTYFQMACDQGNNDGCLYLELMNHIYGEENAVTPSAEPGGQENTETPAAEEDPSGAGYREQVQTASVPPESTPGPTIPVITPPANIPTVPPIAMASGRFQSQTPSDGTAFAPGEAFNLSWTVENTGTTNWDPTYKLIYDNGYNFTKDAITEKTTGVIIWPKGAAALTLPCIAPAETGKYVMKWHVVDSKDNTIIDSLTATINVKEKTVSASSGNSVQISEDYDNWDFSLIVNYDKDDTFTDISTVKRLEKWYSHLLISGGDPGMKIRVTYKSQWPDGYTYYKSFTQPFVSGDAPYESQTYDGPGGETTVGFYDSSGTILLAQRTIWIED